MPHTADVVICYNNILVSRTIWLKLRYNVWLSYSCDLGPQGDLFSGHKMFRTSLSWYGLWCSLFHKVLAGKVVSTGSCYLFCFLTETDQNYSILEADASGSVQLKGEPMETLASAVSPSAPSSILPPAAPAHAPDSYHRWGPGIALEGEGEPESCISIVKKFY